LEHEHGAHVVALFGEHDLSTLEDISAALKDAFDRGPAVILDLTAATFIDSAVIGPIIFLPTRRAESRPENRFAVVVDPGGPADQMLRLVGLELVVSVFPTRGDALAAIT
jgi:anti-sigma B factor antagonist